LNAYKLEITSMSIRYYLHSDRSESDPESFYCAFCDFFAERKHFGEHTHQGKHRERLESSRRSYANLARRDPYQYHRLKVSDNIVEGWPKLKVPVKGRFYRWILRQDLRDDRTGDLAKPIREDDAFPVTTGSLNVVRLYLVDGGACSEALQALDEAWSDFRKMANAREGMSCKARFEIFKFYDYTCQICGGGVKDGAKLEIDHRIPVAKGGTNAMDNLSVLCFQCNRGKGASDL
jgi:uncharacterized protein YozE (UPF0346 family)